MTSAKSQTNRKWTSTDEFRNNHDRIFGTKVSPETAETLTKTLAAIQADLNPFLRPDDGNGLYGAWRNGFLAESWAENPYIPDPSEDGLYMAWENGRAARTKYEES